MELLRHCRQCPIKIIIDFKMSVSINIKHKSSSFELLTCTLLLILNCADFFEDV